MQKYSDKQKAVTLNVRYSFKILNIRSLSKLIFSVPSIEHFQTEFFHVKFVSPYKWIFDERWTEEKKLFMPFSLCRDSIEQAGYFIPFSSNQLLIQFQYLSYDADIVFFVWYSGGFFFSPFQYAYPEPNID